MSNNGHSVDGVLVGAGSLWPVNCMPAKRPMHECWFFSRALTSRLTWWQLRAWAARHLHTIDHHGVTLGQLAPTLVPMQTHCIFVGCF
jgi:hypothetical protein